MFDTMTFKILLSITILLKFESLTGENLYLTPLIGNLEARNVAEVHHKDLFGVKSYSGYLTVDQKFNSNLFFWYFPSETDPNAPLILWLQGGPGSTSLLPIFYENGPFKINNNQTLSRRDPSYITNHNVVYIDSPVGTGFSFTDDDQGYARTESEINQNIHSGLVQFLQLFPELQNNSLFISGECYAGKLILSLSYLIHQKNPTAEVKINLKGLAIGNGFFDPVNQINYGDRLYHLGLLDLNGRNEFYVYTEKVKSLIKNNKFFEAYEVFDQILFSSPSLFVNLTGFQKYFFSLLHERNPDNWELLVQWLKRPDVRASLHVSNDIPFMIMNSSLSNFVMHQIMTSEIDKVQKLLPFYKIMFYNGQLDIAVSHSDVEKILLDTQEQFREAKRSFWHVGENLAGYVTKAGNLSLVLVRNAGHTAGSDQLKWILELITQFTHN